ncbi:ras guanine nucleotide exchange factor domain-containing protein [Zychaea mexicana]|uniref:ras guanine nucleotide exchange factor domain-containing protein n=1 Tax=Zychaea mexicana TaxID=64656 RepID=UPI0022FEBCD1|nr:ras guanine nucleotide exchange factor domain-containing protein [Zychaea mexicana]KAI9494208.1 ras guanine nucleotide exchange factor domain-containing protein [Zychaea mexicana]
MFARRRKSLHSSTPSSSVIAGTAPATPTVTSLTSASIGSSSSPISNNNCDEAKGIVSAIIAAASSEELGWVGVEDKSNDYGDDVYGDQQQQQEPPSPPPAPPIENDPHVFDLLERNSTRFIYYGKRDDPQLTSATIEKLVEKLTKEMDSEFLMDFFLTYRQFVSQIRLCKLLILRFRWALMEDTDERRLVRIRTFVVIRHWLTHYWAHDFVPSRTLRFMLCTFLSQLRTHPIILSSPRDARIIKSLRNVLKRQRKLHSMKEDEDGSIRSSVDTFSSSATSTAAMNYQQQQRWYYNNSSYGTSSTTATSRTSTSHHYMTASLPTTAGRSRGSRKDSAIGMTTPSPSQQLKELKPSISTPTFFSRSRRVSNNSNTSSSSSSYAHHNHFYYHHHYYRSTAPSWTAKVNFSIRSIKRSVPTVCQSLWHTVHNPTSSSSSNSTSASHHYQDPKEGCTCPTAALEGKGERKRTTSLIRSASRIFEQSYPRTSMSTPVGTTTSTTTDPKHPNPLCPLHTIPMTPTPSQRGDGGSLRNSSRLNNRCQQHYHQPSIVDPHIVDYKPFVLQYRSEIIAQQFYIIEQQMLQNVTWDELAELRWRNNSTRRNSTTIDVVAEQGELGGGGIEQLINYFNKTCQWVTSEIVQSRSLDTRVRAIEKYIRIALKCYRHRNYSTLMQILLGLQSPAVSRLEKTWQRIAHYESEIFNELKEMAKPFRNWKNVRMAMNKAIENIAESSAVESILTSSHFIAAVEGRQHQSSTCGKRNSSSNNGGGYRRATTAAVPGCIPFLGLYLSDLVFNAELPTFIAAATSPSSPCCPTSKGDGIIQEEEESDDAELRSRLSTHLVNYNKFRITASVIKHVLAFQVLSRTYDFGYCSELFARLENLRFLDNAEIRKASLLCEE